MNHNMEVILEKRATAEIGKEEKKTEISQILSYGTKKSRKKRGAK